MDDIKFNRLPAHKRLLQERGYESAEDTGYKAYEESEGRPQMGFHIETRKGDLHGFLYHNVDNFEVVTRGDWELASFEHRGKSVTMRGRGLKRIFKSYMRHVLISIHEWNGEGIPEDSGEAFIERIEITSFMGGDAHSAMH